MSSYNRKLCSSLGFAILAASTLPLALAHNCNFDDNNDNDNCGLSTGAKIAIGVAVGVAAIASLIGTFVFSRRRTRRNDLMYGQQPQPQPAYPSGNAQPAYDPAFANGQQYPPPQQQAYYGGYAASLGPPPAHYNTTQGKV